MAAVRAQAVRVTAISVAAVIAGLGAGIDDVTMLVFVVRLAAVLQVTGTVISSAAPFVERWADEISTRRLGMIGALLILTGLLLRRFSTGLSSSTSQSAERSPRATSRGVLDQRAQPAASRSSRSSRVVGVSSATWSRRNAFARPGPERIGSGKATSGRTSVSWSPARAPRSGPRRPSGETTTGFVSRRRARSISRRRHA